MTVRPWLIDKSALVRIGRSPEADKWAERVEQGMVRISTVTLLEAASSARSPSDLAELLDLPPLSRMPVEYVTPASERRTVEVLRWLSELGHNQAPSIPNLMVAATAEQAKLTVLHADKGFELIAGITGQPMERLQVD